MIFSAVVNSIILFVGNSKLIEQMQASLMDVDQFYDFLYENDFYDFSGVVVFQIRLF